MKINGKTYLSSRGYGILKESNPDILQALKDALTVSPKTFSVLGNEKPIQFPVYRENDKKLYLPKNYGLQKCGKPSEVNIPDGEDCPRLVFNGSIRKEQEEPVQCYLEAIADPLRMGGIISLPCGYGKCLAKDTPVLLYNGAIKLSQDITVNDILMGDDSKPRMVLSTCCGKELLYDVIPLIGESYTVNESHILSLRHCKSNKIEDIPLKKFIKLMTLRIKLL